MVRPDPPVTADDLNAIFAGTSTDAPSPVAQPKPNVPLLRQTLAHIEAHPDQWDQTKWVNSCGTAFCFAGHAVRLNGDTIHDTDYVPTRQGEVYIADYAGGLLGLSMKDYVDSRGSYDYGYELFDATNTLADLRRIVGELCGGAE